ncbi:MAG: DUF6629 family protein [Caulobacteraceae bacterium]
MCFSPAASFTAAAVTGVLGLIAVTRTRRPGDLPLALSPILFGAQQAIEGLIWLKAPMDPQVSMTGPLVLSYLLMAQVLWPLYSPVAVLCLETDAKRRRLMLPWLGVGLAVAAWLLWGLLSRPYSVTVGEGHLAYATGQTRIFAIGAGYLAAIGLPLLMSSSRTVVVLGVVVLAGWAVAYAAYLAEFQSVWCYFAAAASVVVIGHFEIVRRRPSALAAG